MADDTSLSDDSAGDLIEELAAAIQAVLTVESVEGIGQPVTVIDPGGLRPDFLGFIERLRGGAIEIDEEMLLITLAEPRGRRRKKALALHRLRQTLVLLCRYVMDQGVTIDDVVAVLDEATRKLIPQARMSKERE